LQENKSFRISLGKVSQLKAAVEALPTSLTKETCVTWFPRIFNELFQIMVSFESNKEVTGLQNDAFVALIEIIKKYVRDPKFHYLDQFPKISNFGLNHVRSKVFMNHVNFIFAD
jgi:cob(I)alamin adenosyltransferase